MRVEMCWIGDECSFRDLGRGGTCQVEARRDLAPGGNSRDDVCTRWWLVWSTGGTKMQLIWIVLQRCQTLRPSHQVGGSVRRKAALLTTTSGSISQTAPSCVEGLFKKLILCLIWPFLDILFETCWNIILVLITESFSTGAGATTALWTTSKKDGEGGHSPSSLARSPGLSSRTFELNLLES